MPHVASELELKLNSDVDQVVQYLVSYIESHPATYYEVVAVVRNIPRSSLPTPTSTPGEEPAKPQSPQHVIQDGPDDTHDQSPPVVTQETSDGGRPLFQAYVETADESGDEQARGDSQHPASLDGQPPLHHNDIASQDDAQEKHSSGKTVASPIQHQLDIVQHGPKRTRSSKDRRVSKRARSDAVVPAGEGDEGDRWTLSPAWRSALQRITSTEGYGYAQDFCYRARFPNFTGALRHNQDAIEEIGGTDDIPASDRRSKQLRFLLEPRDNISPGLEESIPAELAANHEAEKALPRKTGEQSARNKYTDLLFPETIEPEGGKAGKGKKGKGKKGTEVSEEVSKQEEERKVQRTKAKKRLDYWKRLGDPLRIMVERFGSGILVRLPADIREKRLHALSEPQHQEVAEYIDYCHKGLKEQMSTLSSLLPRMMADGPHQPG
ncbi:hypothetical protein DL98DRAFT_542997 [Cadophora sp. DSE1049]|nr:hypothetical protein DL98DRAFT_542997 [Cadophora sp. DSE1049]